MTKKEIITEIASMTGIQQKDVKVVTEYILSAISSELYYGREVSFHGFGTFKVKKKRICGRNFSEKTSMTPEEIYIPSFCPGKSLREVVRLGSKNSDSSR